MLQRGPSWRASYTSGNRPLWGRSFLAYSQANSRMGQSISGLTPRGLNDAFWKHPSGRKKSSKTTKHRETIVKRSLVPRRKNRGGGGGGGPSGDNSASCWTLWRQYLVCGMTNHRTARAIIASQFNVVRVGVIKMAASSPKLLSVKD